MTESEKKTFEAFLSKAFKLDSEAMSRLYNEDGELTDVSVLEEADQTRIKSLKDNADNQYKRGIKEGAAKIEKELRERYEVDSENIGVDLVDEIITAQIEQVKGKADDDISSHPRYLELIAEKNKAIKAKEDEWKLKFESREEDLRKERVFSTAKKKALDKLRSLNPILPEDDRKAQKWQEKYLEEIVRGVDIQEQGDDLILMKDGKELQDDHGYRVSFDDWTQRVAADFFDFRKADDRSTSGEQGQQSQRVKIPTSPQEYAAAIRDAKTPEERQQVAEAYHKRK